MRRTVLSLGSFGLCLLVCACISHYSLAASDIQDDHSIKTIDANNFRTVVLHSNDVWVLDFYSPRCGTCKEFTPVFEQLARRYRHVYYGSVNIDEPAGMKLATESGALEEGVPSVRAYTKRGNAQGTLVWAGDEAPEVAVLAAALNKVVPHSKGALRARKTL